MKLGRVAEGGRSILSSISLRSTVAPHTCYMGVDDLLDLIIGFYYPTLPLDEPRTTLPPFPLDDTCSGQRIMENDDSRTRARDHSGRTSGPSCEGATEQPSPPTPPPTSPLSTSGNPAKLSATRRKLQRHGRICRTQKFRRLTRGANPIFRPDAPLSIATMDRGAYRICGQ